jgi:hypothetical protein
MDGFGFISKTGDVELRGIRVALRGPRLLERRKRFKESV